jgi:hypothetical protein
VIRVVEEHHHALAEWARHRRSCAGAPALLTFDHHTDTLPAFGRVAADETERRRLVAAFDYRDDASVEAALARLRHDEHIDLALRGGVVGRAVIVAHADHPGCANEKIRVVCDRSWPEMQLLLNDPARFEPLARRVFESDFLEARLAEAGFTPEPGFLFDLDLDYLLTPEALKPKDGRLLRHLLGIAGLVTVSMERDWVRLLRLSPGLASDFLLASFEEIAGRKP